MKPMRFWQGAALAMLAYGAAAVAQDFEVGQSVEGCGATGEIIRIDPRPGWDVPFYVIRSYSNATHYDINCTPKQMRAVATSTQIPSAPTREGAAEISDVADLCKSGARLEGQWGISWYEVTVQSGPDANGKCPVSFDGYGRMWDTAISADQLRPRGSGSVNRPAHPVERGQAADPDQSMAVADGVYDCHKISSGGQLLHIGMLNVRDGSATLAGLPEGWTALGISVRGTDDRGREVVAFDYRSESGWNDRLDCTPN